MKKNAIEKLKRELDEMEKEAKLKLLDIENATAELNVSILQCISSSCMK